METSDDNENTPSESGHPPIADGTSQNSPSKSGGSLTNNNNNQTMAENSADSRTPHEIYLELEQAEARSRLFECWPRCRDGCRTLLNDPRMLLTTRVQVLQLLSKLCPAAESEKCLRVATRILDKLDAADPHTITLRETNVHMVSMMEIWHSEQDGVGKGIEGVDYEGKNAGLTEEESNGEEEGGKA